MERVQKIIANSGFCSRRKAEELIERGEVRLNGGLVKLGDKAGLEDKITVSGVPLNKPTKKVYFILNKPKGILVTKDDPKNRRTIYNLRSVSALNLNLNYVGRLDAMSEGLLILTNDGDLIQKLTHPKYRKTKVYQVRTESSIKKADITNLKSGMMIDGRRFFAKISNIKNNTFCVSIQEGRNRIIRRVLEKLGHKVYFLKRISMANIKLGDLKSGEVREISGEEIGQLM
ncbi:rRNA pseudouridine synthase [archaeon]|nr:rRNA pseudouridine synthase [archaeon]